MKFSGVKHQNVKYRIIVILLQAKIKGGTNEKKKLKQNKLCFRTDGSIQKTFDNTTCKCNSLKNKTQRY